MKWKRGAGGTKGSRACNSFKILLNVEVGFKKNLIIELISLFRTVQYEMKHMYSLAFLLISLPSNLLLMGTDNKAGNCLRANATMNDDL